MRRGHWMQVWSGKQFWPLDPLPSEIDIKDIAHSLSKQCRFAGHSIVFYSVAEHCCHVSDACSSEHKLWGLLHDATEAYLVDLPKPVKLSIIEYDEIEQRLLLAVCERFDLTLPMPAEVRRLDNAILENERQQLMTTCDVEWWSNVEPAIPGLVLSAWEPIIAYEEFMTRFHDTIHTSSRSF